MDEGIDRRAFLRHAAGRHRSVTLHCGTLYVRYVDAVAEGRLHSFAGAVAAQIATAHQVKLAEREWLSRDDFRETLERILMRPPTV